MTSPHSSPRPFLRPARHAALWPLVGLALLGGCGGETPDPSADGGPGTAAAPGAGTPGAVSLKDLVAEEVQQMTAGARASLLAETVGLARVSDLGMSDDLIDRATDRRIRTSHHAQYHAVYADREAKPPLDDPAPPPPDRPVSFTLEPHFVPDPVMAQRETARTAVPANRGFRPARVFATPGRPQPETRTPDGDEPIGLDIQASGAWGPAAELIARRLASDGLAATTVRALAMVADDLAASADGGPGDPGGRAIAAVRGLQAVGLPVDLIPGIQPLDGEPTPNQSVGNEDARRAAAAAWVEQVLVRLDRGDDPERLAADAATRAVTVWPASPAFRATADDGVDPLGLIRLQPTRGRYWAGRGGGGSLDLTVSLLEALPDVAFTVSIGTPFRDDALTRMAPAREGASGPVTVIDEPHVITQWAQDNGQPGYPVRESTPWMLAPRYASQGDFGSTLIPGDTWMVEGLPGAGIEVVRSSLLFQGGNALVVTDPADGGRLLLLADAEVDRNIALGLDRPTIIEGFRQEFGVDRVAVLRSPAFHLDFATTVRRVPATADTPARSIAFVHDEDRGHDMMLRLGVDRLLAAGVLDPPTATAVRAALDAGDAATVIQRLGPPLYARQSPDGQWPLTLADAFDDGPGRAGIAVLDRFLCSFERLMGRSVELERVPGPPEVRAYLATWPRRDAVIADFERQLEELGFELVRVPGFSLQSRSVNTINMTHGRDRILRPVSGGTLSAIDDAAGEVIRQAVGPRVRVIDLPTADTQRRSGAVGCAVAAWPRAARTESGPALP